MDRTRTMDSLARRTSQTTLVTTARANAHMRDGRLGHEVKNIISARLLAAVFGWSFVPPSADGAFGFREVDQILDLRGLADRPPVLRMRGGHSLEWKRQGECPPSWARVLLNGTGFSGFETHASLRAYLQRELPADADRLCLVTTQGFRVHLHHVFAWEAQNRTPPGTYEAVTASLRGALRPPSAAAGAVAEAKSGAVLGTALTASHALHLELPAPAAASASTVAWGHDGGASASGRGDSSRRHRLGRVALHVRRGDRVGRGSTGRYPLALVRAFVSLSGRALLATGFFPRGVEVWVHTEPANSSEVFTSGCPAPTELPPLLHCSVTTGTILEDLWGLVHSDVVGLSSSSFSVLAYYLRERWRPALVPVKYIAQFFSAADGSDGRNRSSRAWLRAHRGHEESSCPPPSNLLFMHSVLSQHVAAAPSTSPQQAAAGSEQEADANTIAENLKALLQLS